MDPSLQRFHHFIVVDWNLATVWEGSHILFPKGGSCVQRIVMLKVRKLKAIQFWLVLA
jgi:hypothetical protein